MILFCFLFLFACGGDQDRIIVCPEPKANAPNLPEHYAQGEFVAVEDLAEELGCNDLGQFVAALDQKRATLYADGEGALFVGGQVADQLRGLHAGMGVGGVDVCRPVDWMPPE